MCDLSVLRLAFWWFSEHVAQREIMKKCYLNITNPLKIDEDLQYWDAFSFIRLLYENPQLQKDIKIDGWEEIKEQYEEDLEYDEFDESFYCSNMAM